MSTNTTLTLGHFILCGIQHQPEARNLWRNITRTTPVQIVRERYNPHDPLAISLRTEDDQRLGYIRREDNRILAALIDQGLTLHAQIADLHTRTDPLPEEVQIAITTTLPTT